MIDAIRNFVEGTVSARDFERAVLTDPALQRRLEDEVQLPAFVDAPDLLAYLITQDFEDLGAVYTVQTVLSGVLDRHGVAHTVDARYENQFHLVLKAQPKWLTLPSGYVAAFMQEHGSLGAKERLARLKERIAGDFRCLKSPPKWLQAPEWPFVDGAPLVFVGQLDITALRHDTAQVYVFFDERHNAFHTIGQRC